MALWNGLGQAATVAQLAGVDAGGLISMIVQAVQTVRRNREECRQLMHHVMMIGDLLQMLEQSETMQRPEIRRPLDGLEDTLRQAYMLVTSCQQSSTMYRFLMGRNHAQKFRDVRDRITSYLLIYPLISHIDTGHSIAELSGRAHPSAGTQPQASEEAPESSTSHANPDSHFRTQGSASDYHDTEPGGVSAVTEPSVVEEQQTNGYENAEVLQNWWHRFRLLFQRTRRETTAPENLLGILGHEQTGGFKVFNFSELATSTNNFSYNNIIGSGSFGEVYKGRLSDRIEVAVKRSRWHDMSSRPDFQNEVQIIPRLQHVNIVKLLGFCIEGETKILIYEYMPRGSLHFIIHELRAGVSVAWSIRFKIIEGIAQGAVYLHHHSRLCVVHGDLKPGNILLDYDMTPKITDFGIAKVLSSDDEHEETTVAGTPGYIDPNLIATRIISTKNDVYSFGITSLEIITTQNVSYALEGQSLVDHAMNLWTAGRAMELVDPSLRDDPQISHILRCIHIGLLCIQRDPADRPTMSDVLMMMNCESMSLPVLRFPTYNSQETENSSFSNESPRHTSFTSAESTTEEENPTYFSCSSSDADNDDTSITASGGTIYGTTALIYFSALLVSVLATIYLSCSAH